MLPKDTLLDETVFFKTVDGLKWIIYVGILNNRLWNDRAKMRPKGVPPKDPLWDETVSFKTVIGLKWITWGSGKIDLGAMRQKCVPRGSP